MLRLKERKKITGRFVRKFCSVALNPPAPPAMDSAPEDTKNHRALQNSRDDSVKQMRVVPLHFPSVYLQAKQPLEFSPLLYNSCKKSIHNMI